MHIMSMESLLPATMKRSQWAVPDSAAFNYGYLYNCTFTMLCFPAMVLVIIVASNVFQRLHAGGMLFNECLQFGSICSSSTEKHF